MTDEIRTPERPYCVVELATRKRLALRIKCVHTSHQGVVGNDAHKV